MNASPQKVSDNNYPAHLNTETDGSSAQGGHDFYLLASILTKYTSLDFNTVYRAAGLIFRAIGPGHSINVTFTLNDTVDDF